MSVRATQITAFVAFVLLAVGCKMGQAFSGEWKRYRGPERSADEIAVLCVQECTMTGCDLKVSRVDGRIPGGIYSFQAFPPNMAGKLCFHLLPGEHEIDAKYQHAEGDGTATVTDRFRFKAVVEAGKTYAAIPRVIGGGLKVEIAEAKVPEERPQP